MPRLIDLFVLALFSLVSFELGSQFRAPPVPPHVMKELPRFDPTMAPKAMSATCRAEGKQLIAIQADGDVWGFDCVRAP